MCESVLLSGKGRWQNSHVHVLKSVYMLICICFLYLEKYIYFCLAIICLWGGIFTFNFYNFLLCVLLGFHFHNLKEKFFKGIKCE